MRLLRIYTKSRILGGKKTRMKDTRQVDVEITAILPHEHSWSQRSPTMTASAVNVECDQQS